MICMFCKNEMAEGEIKCPVCGFTHMNFTEEGGAEVIKNMVTAYKQRKLGGIFVELVSYNYTVENGVVKDDGESHIKICEASELEMDTVKWSGSSFYGPEKERNISIDIVVGNEQKKKYSLPFHIPAVSELLVGVKLEKGLKARLAAGERDNFVLSEQFDLCTE